MNTEQKIRECAAELASDSAHIPVISQILTRHFGQPEQPDKSLDEIVEKYAEGSTLELHTRTSHAIRNACHEYAATKTDEATEIYRKAWLEALDEQNAAPYHYFKVHEVERPLPIDTEILLNDGRWVEACSWPQYDATINYQARVKKPFALSALSAVK